MLRLWDARDGRLPVTLRGSHHRFRSVALSTDGHLVARGSIDGAVDVRDATTGQRLSTLEGHGAVVRAVALSADRQMVAGASFHGTVRLWNGRSGVRWEHEVPIPPLPYPDLRTAPVL